MLRKLVTTLTVLVLVLGIILPVQLFAEDDIGYEGRICRDLGILKGNTGVVDNAYLDTRPSRLQAAIMFLRLKGLEQDALSYTGGGNFKDAGTVAWDEGRNVLSYLKNHPELGWIGDGVNFLPYNLIDSKAYYKVLLESLGYKQKIDEDGDFAWDSVLDYAAGKGLYKVANTKNFTVRSLAIATVEALETKMKNSGKKLIEYLVDIGDVDMEDAISLGLYSRNIEASVKAVRAISNSKVEVVFDEPVVGSQANDKDLYTIRQLDIKKVSVKNVNAVIIDTSAMSESATYTLSFNDKNFSFRGMKKDSNAPKLIAAECKDTDLVELSFDRVLDNVSAQATDTYTISGVAIKSAELDSTNTKVRIITSGIETGHSYELNIHNIKNGDGVTAKLITKRFTGKKDTNPPKLNKLTVLNNTKLLLEFSDVNGLNKASAQDRDNYKITSGSEELDIVSVRVKDNDDDGLWESVELSTDSQSAGKAYTLSIKDISDDSVLGNKITKEIRKDFRGKAKDTSAPTVDHNPKAITNNIVEIVFRDANALDVESACDPDNYELDGDLDIEEIRIKNPNDLYSVGGKTVYLITSEMDKSKYYTLTIKGIKDEFGNELKESTSSGYKKYKFRGIAKDNIPPYVTFVECIDSKTIEVKFDNPLDKDSAENTANYRIDGLVLVAKARLQGDEKTVRLTVSSLSSDKNHTILMNDIKDISGNSLSNISVSVVYNGNMNDTDPPEVEYIEAMNEDEIWVHFDEEVNARTAKLKASGITFEQVGEVLDAGTTVVMKASKKMSDVRYEVTSLTGVRDIHNNAYKFEDNLDFYGSDMENDPPRVDDWQQLDVKRFRVIFSEPVLSVGVSGIKNPSGVSLSWKAIVNPEDEDTNEAYSTVDYIASKAIPAGKEYKFNFTSMITDYIGKGAYDEGDYGSASNATILESYLEDDEDPYIEYVEAITSTKVQVVFNEAIDADRPGTYKITYRDDNDKLKTIRISRVEVDSKDRAKVNILTADELSQEFVYTLVPVTAAADIAGNRLDTHSVEIDFEGSNVRSSDYMQGVEFQNDKSFKIINSSKIYNKITALYELDTAGDTIGGNIIAGDSTPVSDNVHRVTSKKPLLGDVRYKITVDGLEYRFYGGVQNGDIELDTENRKITFDGMDVNEYYVEAFRADGDEVNIIEKRGDFIIDASERLRNGEYMYIYVNRKSDGVIIYGTRIEIEGMPTASSSNKITSFSFTSLNTDATGSIDEGSNTIKVSVPHGTDVQHLAAAFKCSEDAVVKVGSVTQVSGKTANDFTNEVIYTVIAQDGSKAYYKVIVTIEASKLEKKIKSFVFEELKPKVTGIIDEKNHVITLELPDGTSLKALKPTIETSPGTTIYPESGIENDFSEPVIYKVTAKDGSVQNYTVTANVRLSSENSIRSFKFEGVYAFETVITGGSENTISIKVPYNTNVADLTPIITISEGAKITPESGKTKNFTNEVIYTVTAQDGSKRDYKVSVTVETSKLEKNITSFGFEILKKEVIGVIDQEKQEIVLTVPFGTNIKTLKPKIITSPGAEVTPGSGEPMNFTDPVEYKVKAKDGSSRSYKVKVTVAKELNKSISSFEFEELKPAAAGKIDEEAGTITVAVPYGTDITKLVPTITIPDNTEIDPKSGEAQNFRDSNKPVVYTVTAEDGTTKEYSVYVKKALSSAKSITSFSFPGLNPPAEVNISERLKTIAITVPQGTDVSSLKAVFTASPEAVVKVGEVEQVSGNTKNDFTKEVTYTVIALDGTAQGYIVTVSTAQSSEKSIKEFGFTNPHITGEVDEATNNIRVTVPYETDVTKLAAVFKCSDGCTVKVNDIVQKSGETVNDFKDKVIYTVVAQDGSTRNYTVEVSAAASSEKRIGEFRLKTQNTLVKATIDETGHKIYAAVPRGTDLTRLAAVFTYTGRSITVGGAEQTSGSTENDFSDPKNPVVYTITALDNTTAEYTVIVTINKNRK